MAVSAMEREERLEIGEKIFVSSIMVTLVTEAGVGLVGNGLQPLTWPGVLYSVLSFAVLAALANWLYKGDPAARRATLAWVGFQVALSALALGVARRLPALNFLAQPTPWLAALKLVVYAGLGAVLLRSRNVQAFLAHKRGEEHVHVPAAGDLAPTPTGVTVPLSEAQEQSVGALALLLQAASLVLLAVGVFRVLLGVQEINDARLGTAVTAGVVTLLEGVVTALLGVFLLVPAGAVQLLRSEGADTAFVVNAAESLKSFFEKQILLGVALVAVLITGIVVWFLR
jgi:hypothetical protein